MKWSRILREISPRSASQLALCEKRKTNSLHIPETSFSKACLRGLMDSRSSLLSKIETGRTVRCKSAFCIFSARCTYSIVHCSPLGVDDHEISSSVSSSLCFLDALLSELLDRPRSVNVSSIGTGSEDSTNKGWAVLVRPRKECSDSLPISTSSIDM
jgi:hypothetical protein